MGLLLDYRRTSCFVILLGFPTAFASWVYTALSSMFSIKFWLCFFSDVIMDGSCNTFINNEF